MFTPDRLNPFHIAHLSHCLPLTLQRIFFSHHSSTTLQPLFNHSSTTLQPSLHCVLHSKYFLGFTVTFTNCPRVLRKVENQNLAFQLANNLHQARLVSYPTCSSAKDTLIACEYQLDRKYQVSDIFSVSRPSCRGFMETTT